MNKKIKSIIKNNNEYLDKAIELLMQEIVEANIYNKLVKDIIMEIKGNKILFNQSKTFWHLTIKALKDARMIRLCRIFDKENNSISIINILEAIKANNSLFSTDNFKIRLKDNPHLDSLSKYNRGIDLLKLEKEIKEINGNKIVNKIIKLRNNFVAHKSLKLGLTNFIGLKNYNLDIIEIDNILDYCFNILNDYMQLFKATTWSKTIIGHDDYKGFITFFNMGLDKYNSKIENEITRIRKK